MSLRCLGRRGSRLVIAWRVIHRHSVQKNQPDFAFPFLPQFLLVPLTLDLTGIGPSICRRVARICSAALGPANALISGVFSVRFRACTRGTLEMAALAGDLHLQESDCTRPTGRPSWSGWVDGANRIRNSDVIQGMSWRTEGGGGLRLWAPKGIGGHGDSSLRILRRVPGITPTSGTVGFGKAQQGRSSSR